MYNNNKHTIIIITLDPSDILCNVIFDLKCPGVNVTERTLMETAEQAGVIDLGKYFKPGLIFQRTFKRWEASVAQWSGLRK